MLAGSILLDLPLEDLLKVEITSASRKSQHVQEVAAAVFVITREDIERSGARNIPEALRGQVHRQDCLFCARLQNDLACIDAELYGRSRYVANISRSMLRSHSGKLR